MICVIFLVTAHPAGLPKISFLFHPLRSFFISLGGGGVYSPQSVTPRRQGSHKMTPKTPTALKRGQYSTRRPPEREREKKRNWEREKKNAKMWAPPFAPRAPFGPPTRPRTLRALPLQMQCLPEDSTSFLTMSAQRTQPSGTLLLEDEVGTKRTLTGLKWPLVLTLFRRNFLCDWIEDGLRS